MFSIYLADLNNFLASKCTGLDYLNNILEEPLNDELTTSYDILERLELRFCKYMLSVNKYTCSNMIYGELGVTPLSIDVSIRMVVYWTKLVSSNQNKISNNDLLYII